MINTFLLLELSLEYLALCSFKCLGQLLTCSIQNLRLSCCCCMGLPTLSGMVITSKLFPKLLPSREGTFTTKFTGHIFIFRTKTRRKLDIPHRYKSISSLSQKNVKKQSQIFAMYNWFSLAWVDHNLFE